MNIMAKANQTTPFELVLNGLSENHATIVKSLLHSSNRFLCMTAFGKETGFKSIRKDLKKLLEAGLRARFVVGLNFYQTDPPVLEELQKLVETKRYALELFVSSPSWKSPDASTDVDAQNIVVSNFHPKVFVFEYARGTSVLIGSANLTGGGLENNHEASILIRDGGEAIAKSMDQYIEQLIQDKQIVLADAEILHEYRRRHAIYKVHNRLGNWRTQRAFEQKQGLDIETLSGYLTKMKADKTEQGFDAQKTSRTECRAEALKVLGSISSSPPLSESSFLKLYEPLVANLWHSGGLQRNKNIVASQAHAFQAALRSLGSIESLGVEKAFDALILGMQTVTGVGINVITEILHTMDNQRFVVMNQNAVAGLERAGFSDFPKHPGKNNVDAARYASFCKIAGEVRDQLNLKNFTELDALFNYAYWD